MESIKKQIQDSIETKKALLGDEAILEFLSRVIECTKECLKNGNKILIAGNGGSAADAQHFAAEIVGRYKKERRGYPAVALTTDTSVLTAVSNDYDFTSLFSRQIEALGGKGDIFFGISTSGNSKNVIEGLKKARTMGLTTIALSGRDGGEMRALADISLIVPSNETARIQESHIMLIHIICEEAEKNLK